MISKDEKRQDIAAMARVLFTDYGYKSVSIDQIAQKAQVAKGTVYLYFKDKEEILAYLFKEALLPIWKMAEEINAKELPILDEIHQIVYNFLMYRHNHKFIYKIVKEARELNTPSACRAIKQVDHDILTYLDKRLQQAVEQRKLRPMNTTTLSFIIIKVYNALAFEWEEEHEKLNEEQIAQSVRLFLKDGLILNEI